MFSDSGRIKCNESLPRGTPDPGICQTEKIAKPIQAHFGADDNLAGFSDPAAAAKLAENLKVRLRSIRV